MFSEAELVEDGNFGVTHCHPDDVFFRQGVAYVKKPVPNHFLHVLLHPKPLPVTQ